MMARGLWFEDGIGDNDAESYAYQIDGREFVIWFVPLGHNDDAEVRVFETVQVVRHIPGIPEHIRWYDALDESIPASGFNGSPPEWLSSIDTYVDERTDIT